ncbi:MAG: methylmalonic aciduria and homocystinuria type D protein [Leptolyngbya sp.]|nr:MAG: methylmalonic aciduria and homocystinuria type D protein [Leptolyngbya sp.]
MRPSFYPAPPPMLYSVHPPSPFISRYAGQLLPSWSCSISSVLIVLQQADCELMERSPMTETQKQVLRDRFLRIGSAITAELQDQAYQADLFDPKTGLPILSHAGRAIDAVAVVRACLGYATMEINGCAILLHPEWGNAVYPAVLVSSAMPTVVEQVANRVMGAGGLIDNGTSRFRRSEYHHSFIGCGNFTQ